MFNMVPKPTRRNDAAATFDVVKPDSDVEDLDRGRLDGGEYPSCTLHDQLKTRKKHRRREKRGQRWEAKSDMGDWAIQIFRVHSVEMTSTEAETVQCDWKNYWLKEFEVY